MANTPNLGLIKPIVGADEDAWGEMLNANSDTLDSKVVKKSGDTMTGDLTVSHADWPGISVDYTDNTGADFCLRANGGLTWDVSASYPDNDFFISRYPGTDVSISSPLQISHATGTTTLTGEAACVKLTNPSSGMTVGGDQWPGIYLHGTDGSSPGIAFGNGPADTYKLLWEIWPDDPVALGGTGDFDILRFDGATDTLLNKPLSISHADGTTTLNGGLVVNGAATINLPPGDDGVTVSGAWPHIDVTSTDGTGPWIALTNGSPASWSLWMRDADWPSQPNAFAISNDAFGPADPLAQPFVIDATTSAASFSVSPTAPTPATADNSTKLATTAFIKAQGYLTSASGYTPSAVAITGGTINGTSIGATTPSTGAFTNLSASGTVSGTGFANLLSPYAKIDSQAFTGTPALPTGTTGITQTTADSSTKLATTAFVKAQAYATTASLGTMSTQNATAVAITGGAVNGTTIGATTAAAGTFTNLTASGTVSGAGFTTLLSTYAKIDSQAFTGTPSLPTGATAVTQTAADSSTKLATTAFVKAQSYLTANQSISITGDVTGSGATAITATVAKFQGRPFAATLPTTGQVIGWNGSTWLPQTNTPTPGGTTGQIQYNNAGAMGGIAQNGSGTVVMTTGAASVSLNGLTVTGGGISTTSISASAGALGTTLGSSLTPLQAFATDNNGDALQSIITRNSAGSDWSTASWKIRRNVDATVMGYVEFGANNLRPLSFGSGATEFANFDANGALSLKAANPVLALNKNASGGSNTIKGSTAGVDRWGLQLGDVTSESTGNVGSHFILWRYNDAGGIIDAPFTVNRTNGCAYFGQTIQAQGGMVIQNADPVILMNKSATGHANNIYGQTNGAVRWGLTLGDGSAESTGNAGSDFDIARFNDAGAFIDNVFTINRASGAAAFSKTLTSGNHTINGAAASIAAMYLNKPASGQQSTIYGQNNGLQRWGVALGDAAAESTGNLGSNFAVNRYNDAGTYVDTPLAISRSTGQMDLAGNIVVKGGSAVLQPAAAGDAIVFLNKSGSTKNSAIYGQTGASSRWVITPGDAMAESGSNAGSNFTIARCNDAGVFIDQPMFMVRSTGITSFSQPIVNGSDIALKENVSSITNALAKVLKLDGVAYNQRGSKRRDIGLVAQAVKKIVPEVVFNVPSPTDPDKEILGIAYSQLVGLLVNAVKELNAKVEALEGRK